MSFAGLLSLRIVSFIIKAFMIYSRPWTRQPDSSMESYETAAKSVSPFLGGINELLLLLFLSLLGKSREAKKRRALKYLRIEAVATKKTDSPWERRSAGSWSCTRFSLSFYGILPITGTQCSTPFHQLDARSDIILISYRYFSRTEYCVMLDTISSIPPSSFHGLGETGIAIKWVKTRFINHARDHT